ncbi:alpha-D-ribose 1-methylphosphonate 5-triphosphate synthase subunit PhnI [Alteribacillus persepolensis]|uniref:Alpha-D-ribose 1-methylphosphonate 5-triphosphate synthase subunit PhnI n=1 Tax=Alteribacillus persepolensis TaxID=568899 RepID=A0A1G8GVB1_9BACI|nr:carbon-phosphorus lyase complex subunit PhnI [Alteribacillus persepolensis]SDH98344.1 alpha-D-ribose 1-methylphosphonate 5-triphosphate synthase subunit PhnI [Alteribacillus persepolensis]
MGYVAVKGGTKAIEASKKRLKYERLKDGEIIEIKTILSSMKALVDQVMSEASFYSPFLAALAIKQAEGSMEEAVFLMRAHRSTLPRLYYSQTVETESMFVKRRISASFKDIPGGQMLGATYDYTHRLLDFELAKENTVDNHQWLQAYKQELQDVSREDDIQYFPKVVDYLREEGLFEEYEDDNTSPMDITKESIQFPTPRSARLQTLTRGQTGAVTSLGYASLRGYGQVHPTVGEVRVGDLPIYVDHPTENNENAEDNDFYIGEITVSEVESFVPVSIKNDRHDEELEFEIGYGVCYGQNETKAIAMSILDQCLEHPEFDFPTHSEEFVLLHIDSVESTGFISHLKLPHYVTFQSKLDSIRQVKKGATSNES